MRKIEQEMTAAIKGGKTWHKDNTQVIVNLREDGATITSVYLHGNLIAQTGKDGGWVFCLCGWNTTTTRSRINAIIGSIRTSAEGIVIPGLCSYKGKPHIIAYVEGKAKRMPIGSDMWFNPLCVVFS